MPTFDGGHYFLTALVPIRTEVIADQGGVTSPVHALRKVLAQLPATPTIQFYTEALSPLAASRSLHFARFVVIDDVAYNGRVQGDTILTKIAARRNPRLGNPVIAQEQDHLNRPYMLIAMDFDAVDGNQTTRDAFLRELWSVAGSALADILQYAVGFDRTSTSASGFAAYIGECQIETTMPFNDYGIAKPDPPLVDWEERPSTKPFIYALVGGGVAFALGLLGLTIALVLLLFGLPLPGLALTTALLFVLGFIVIGVTVYAGLGNLETAGRTPFPTSAGTTLPSVLKSLYLQRAFTDFAIANQVAAAAPGSQSDTALHAAFASFLAQHKPSVLGGPTQPPGVLGI